MSATSALPSHIPPSFISNTPNHYLVAPSILTRKIDERAVSSFAAFYAKFKSRSRINSNNDVVGPTSSLLTTRQNERAVSSAGPVRCRDSLRRSNSQRLLAQPLARTRSSHCDDNQVPVITWSARQPSRKVHYDTTMEVDHHLRSVPPNVSDQAEFGNPAKHPSFSVPHHTPVDNAHASPVARGWTVANSSSNSSAPVNDTKQAIPELQFLNVDKVLFTKPLRKRARHSYGVGTDPPIPLDAQSITCAFPGCNEVVANDRTLFSAHINKTHCGKNYSVNRSKTLCPWLSSSGRMCGKQVAVNALFRHVLDIHTSLIQYKCKACGERFRGDTIPRHIGAHQRQEEEAMQNKNGDVWRERNVPRRRMSRV